MRKRTRIDPLMVGDEDEGHITMEDQSSTEMLEAQKTDLPDHAKFFVLSQ